MIRNLGERCKPHFYLAGREHKKKKKKISFLSQFPINPKIGGFAPFLDVGREAGWSQTLRAPFSQHDLAATLACIWPQPAPLLKCLFKQVCLRTFGNAAF